MCLVLLKVSVFPSREILKLCQSQTVCVCYRQSVTVTYSRYMLLKVFVTEWLCLSIYVSKTLLNKLWFCLYLFINHLHQDLSVRYKFVRNLGTHGSHFLDPCQKGNGLKQTGLECILKNINMISSVIFLIMLPRSCYQRKNATLNKKIKKTLYDYINRIF